MDAGADRITRQQDQQALRRLGMAKRWWWAGVGALASLLMLGACASKSSAVIVVPTATAGQVRLTTDHATYTASQPIGITVSNTSGSDFYALTGQAACTFLQLQRYDSGHKQWSTIDGCTGSAPTQSLLIRSHMTEPLSLAPGASPTSNVWQAGTYRIALTYSASSDGKSSPQVAYSKGFAITQSGS
jgi:hypothetical protein